MNKIYTLVFAVIFSVSLWAQSPQKMSYQAVIRGTNNNLVVNQKVGIRISILLYKEDGKSVYTETHIPKTNVNGLVTVILGGGNLVSGDFTKIDWSKGPYFVKTETDVLGGTNYDLSTVNELMSVPYALYAANSPAGAKGEAGVQGPAGKDGAPGKDGSLGIQGLKGDTGPQGIEGLKGDTGLTGDKGDIGTTGAQGIQGLKGDNGSQGIQGLKGDTGLTGVKGDVGATGPQGIQGLKGDKGDTGAQGIQGLKGDTGLTGVKGDVGATGPQGIQGLKGDIGFTGAKGDVGATGAQGPQGLKGDKGDTGAQGIQGLKGDTGLTGVKGDVGAIGAQGLKGDKGDTGAQGPQGIQGLKGDVGFTGAKGDVGANGVQGPQGLKGDTGLTGVKGDVGAIGPQGIQGLKGDTGLTGDKGDKGDTGAQGPQGIQGLKGDIGFTGAKGDVGATGAQGLKGDKGDTGAQGIQGLKGDTGLTGVKGDVGATGPQGIQGLKGDTGLTGVKGDVGATGAQGPQGLKGDTGLSGTQGLKGDTGSNGANGSNGQNTLVKTSVETAGINCTNGGTKVEFGLDVNNNGVLDAIEVNASLTKYVCNGADGAKNAWGLNGNNETTSGSNFIGTTDAKDFVVKTKNIERLRVTSTGNIGIGSNVPVYTLTVKDSGDVQPFGIVDQSNNKRFEVDVENDIITNVSNVRMDAFPLDASSQVKFRFLRTTNTSGPKSIEFLRGNNTTQVSALIGIDGLNSYFQTHGGNFGIGTVNPAVKLDVAGSIRSTSSLDLPISVITSPIFSGNFGTPDIGRMFIGDGTGWKFHFSRRSNSINTDLLTINDYGKVGIGTSNPLGKFHVNNDIIGSDSSFVVTTNGFVGIGTVSPSRALTIESQDAPLRLKALNDGCYAEFYTPAHLNSASRAGWIGYGSIIKKDFFISNQVPNGGIFFKTKNIDRMIIDSIGNVGIGITSPLAQVHLYNSSSTIGSMAITTENSVNQTKPSRPAISTQLISGEIHSNANTDLKSDWGFMRLSAGGGINNTMKSFIDLSGFSTDISLKNTITIGTVGTERVRVDAVGNVGIGTSSPARTLHVNDVMRLEPRATTPSNPSKGDMYFDSTINKLRVYDGTTWQNCW